MLARCGAHITEEDGDGADHVVRLGPSALVALRARRPRRPVPGRLLDRGRLRGARAARSRWSASTSGAGAGAILDVLARMGASIEEVPTTGPGDLAATADVVARSGPLHGHRGRRVGDHRARRGARPGRGGGVRLGRHGVPGRGGAAGEGVRSPGRGGRAGAGVRRPRRGRRRRPGGARGRAAGRRPRSTPAATTAWPWPRRWPGWRRGPSRRGSRDGRRWPPATPASPRDLARSPGP